MDVTVAQLRSFLAVAEELHFGRAAERLRVSPSSLSEHVATLERRVGRPLFHRTSRAVVLTDDGKALLPLAHRAVDALDDVTRWARTDTGRSVVRIGVSVFSPRSRTIFAAAHREIPEIDWQLEHLGFGNPFRALRDGTVDCALVPMNGPAPADVTAVELWTEACVLIVADSHPLAARDSVRLADIRDQTFITVADETMSDDWLGDALHDAPRTLPIARSFDEVVELCAAGSGVNVAGASAAQMYQRPGVRFLPIDDLGVRPTYLCVANGRSTPALRRFSTLARRVAATFG